jgi:hypothetical protein
VRVGDKPSTWICEHYALRERLLVGNRLFGPYASEGQNWMFWLRDERQPELRGGTTGEPSNISGFSPMTLDRLNRGLRRVKRFHAKAIYYPGLFGLKRREPTTL